MSTKQYNDIIVEITGQVGTIKLNRPHALNSFGGKLLQETIDAVRDLNEHPDTVFTVLTGQGRYFSAGADIRGGTLVNFGPFANNTEAKLAFSTQLFPGVELVRSIIEHQKVLVVALNGPAVGGGAAWFLGLADIIFAVESSFLQVPFSALGLVPENGSIRNFAQSMGVHRANDFLMFGRKLTAQELEQWGLVNRILPAAGFHEGVEAFLQEQLRVNDGRSMMLAKQLQNAPLRAERLLALYDAADALAERFVDGTPLRRLAMKGAELEAKSKKPSHL
ncbi:Enoyl-CoA delta isomerase 2 [Metarhizium brunneum]|uniref:Enoyl-CoA delta isomerase 2 n=1 Tax=Metarhizium brunneum TaxID=500148 RepID=A0A7D5V5U9_9HYPO